MGTVPLVLPSRATTRVNETTEEHFEREMSFKQRIHVTGGGDIVPAPTPSPLCQAPGWLLVQIFKNYIGLTLNPLI